MIGTVFDWVLQWQLRRLTYPDQGAEGTVVTARVEAAFGTGASLALRKHRTASVHETERALPLAQRGFFWEGYAFGLAALHALGSGSGATPDSGRLVPHYRIMHYTGYGFYQGVASKFGLPKLSFEASLWREVEDFDRYGPLLAGGAGFAAVAFARELTAKPIERITRLVPPAWADAVVHGAGRAAWFLTMYNPVKTLEIIRAMPDRIEDYLEGLGSAIVFTHLSELDRVAAIIASFEPAARPPLLRGVAFALHHAVEDDPAVRSLVEGTGARSLASVYSWGDGIARRTGAAETWYGDWNRLARLAEAVPLLA